MKKDLDNFSSSGMVFGNDDHSNNNNSMKDIKDEKYSINDKKIKDNMNIELINK